MTTFADMVAHVRQNLIGYSKDQATITYLAQPMDANDTTFSVDTETSTAITRGIVEIEDELILVKKFDRSSGVVTVMANESGRGVEGTTAASHAVDTIVTSDPRYPRIRIKEAINDTITSTYPDLWVFGAYEFPKNAAQFEYELPEEVDEVYRVTFNTIGPSLIWQPMQNWRFNPQATTTVLGQTVTGKTIQILDRIVPGRAVRVVYKTKPNVMTSNADVFETVTGFPDRYKDMIEYGATARMLGANEAARLQQQSIESTERAPLVPTGAATDAAKYYWGLYYERLAREQDRLADLYPTFTHFLT